MELERQQFGALIRLRLGVPLAMSPSKCLSCGKDMDVRGYHALLCASGGDRVIRHNAVRDWVFRLCKEAWISRQQTSSPPITKAAPCKDLIRSLRIIRICFFSLVFILYLVNKVTLLPILCVPTHPLLSFCLFSDCPCYKSLLLWLYS